MIKKTHTYVDFNGQQRTEDFYFNLTEAELTEMEYSLNGGLSQVLEKIIKENDERRIMDYFKEIVIRSYGEKSLDGRLFVKNDKIREEFASTVAYSDIFMELSKDAKKAAEFVNGILPQSKTKERSNLTPLSGPGSAPVEAAIPLAAN